MNKVMSDKRVIALYVLPALLFVLALIYVPIVLTGYYGLMQWDGIGAKTFVGLDNFARLVRDDMFWSSVLHSVLLAVFSTLSLVLYMAVALVLSSSIRGAGVYRKIYLIPMLLSSVAIAQLWLKMYHPTIGIVNWVLDTLGVRNTPDWLADPNIVLYAVFVPILWQYAGFYILIYYAALRGVPAEIVEAARIDGANAWQIAWRIRVPLIAEVFKVTVVLAVVGSLKYFDLIYVMTGGGPNGASEVIASYMYRTAFRIKDFGYASAIAFMLLILCLVLTWGIRRFTASKDPVTYA